MDFESQQPNFDNQKLEEMYENLTSISKQLALLQGFMESKFGSEFTTFCQLSEQGSSSSSANEPNDSNNSLQDDSEEYDKMPNLVSQESPSRTLGYVTVPLRQTTSSTSGPSSKFHNAQNIAPGTSRRDRANAIKEEMSNENDDMMYPLHNFSDLLVESAEEVDATESPEFLELELDPSTLLRGEPPALQPMFADNGSSDLHGAVGNHNGATSGHFKRNSSRQNSNNNNNNFHRYELEISASSQGGVAHGSSNNSVSRRASVGNHDNSLSHKKFDCLICGIKFEFAETLKSHMDSHSGSRNIRSNSEEQSSPGHNSTAPPPLPRLLPRPLISNEVKVKVDSESGDVKPTRSKKSHQGTSSSSMKVVSSIKRRRHYNQSRPCSLICPECGLKIRDKSRLIEHLRGHTGERPFQCNLCDKSYTRKDVLKTHMVKMHGESPQT